uniref:Uncharacterized protein n=1 Tax=Ciona intestinalis TaxID=7719 RepID=H2XV48_CIOIN
MYDMQNVKAKVGDSLHSMPFLCSWSLTVSSCLSFAHVRELWSSWLSREDTRLSARSRRERRSDFSSL